jgi:hypothetical protein
MDSLDTRIAHALGWRLINADEPTLNDVNGDPVEGGPTWVDQSGAWRAWAWAFHPSRDGATIPLLLAEVERRGLIDDYVEHLIVLVNTTDLLLDQWPRFTDIFKLMTATPEQHCRAFLAVIGDVNAAA